MELSDRIPYKLFHAGNGRPEFRWLHTGGKKFTEPFFGETISSCMSLPPNREGFPVSSAEELVAAASQADAVEPAAFIFHISRCGSTLLSQLLSRDERCIVLSEVPLLDELLRFPFSHETSQPSQEELFRATLRLLGKKTSGKEKFLFVKTDSWHIMLYERIRRWYPQTPAFLLYRSPAEVMRSHGKLKGMHAIPGMIEPGLFGFEREAIMHLHPAPYLEMVLERYFETYLQILGSGQGATALSFHDGPMRMLQHVAEVTGIHFDEAMLEGMKERAGAHSKFPGQPFVAEDGVPEEKGKVGELFERLKSLSFVVNR